MATIDEITWEGKPLRELTLEEAREAIVILCGLSEQSHKNFNRMLDLFSPKATLHN